MGEEVETRGVTYGAGVGVERVCDREGVVACKLDNGAAHWEYVLHSDRIIRARLCVSVTCFKEVEIKANAPCTPKVPSQTNKDDVRCRGACQTRR